MMTFLKPYCRPAIWGGSRLSAYYQTELDNIAEAWVYSVLKGQSSTTQDGTPLADYLLQSGESQEQIEKQPLIKYIDTSDFLSVQVHPDDIYAQCVEGKPNGKTEMWYILHAEPDAFVYMGLATSRDVFLEALSCGQPEKALKKVYVKEGDVFFIPPGMVHALGKGITLLEVQQPSDLTYRLWDYERRDSEGNLRPLHTEKALDVLKSYSQSQLNAMQFSEPLSAEWLKKAEGHRAVLAATPYFYVVLGKNEAISCVASEHSPACLLILEGEGTLCENGISFEVKAGDSILLQSQTEIMLAGQFTYALVALPTS